MLSKKFKKEIRDFVLSNIPVSKYTYMKWFELNNADLEEYFKLLYEISEESAWDYCPPDIDEGMIDLAEANNWPHPLDDWPDPEIYR